MDGTDGSSTTTGLGLRALRHVGLPVRHLESSLAFWNGALGIPKAATQPAAPREMWLAVAGVELRLFESAARGEAAVPVTQGAPWFAGMPTLVVETGGLADAADLLADRDVALLATEIDFDGDRAALLVEDPNGYWIAIVERALSDEGSVFEGKEPLVLDLAGLTLPVTSSPLAMKQFAKTMGLRPLARSLGDPRRPGVEVGSGRKLVFVQAPLAACRYGSFDGVPPHELQIGFDASLEEARAAMRARGERPREDLVALRTGGAEERVFTTSTTARLFVALRDASLDVPIDVAAGVDVSDVFRNASGEGAAVDAMTDARIAPPR